MMEDSSASSHGRSGSLAWPQVPYFAMNVCGRTCLQATAVCPCGKVPVMTQSDVPVGTIPKAKQHHPENWRSPAREVAWERSQPNQLTTIFHKESPCASSEIPRDIQRGLKNSRHNENQPSHLISVDHGANTDRG